MITVIGVGHVFDIGGQVRQAMLDRHPRVVGVELDKARCWSLTNREGREGGGVMYKLLSHFQRKIAHEYGVEVGDEMLAATRTAGGGWGGVALPGQCFKVSLLPALFS